MRIMAILMLFFPLCWTAHGMSWFNQEKIDEVKKKEIPSTAEDIAQLKVACDRYLQVVDPTGEKLKKLAKKIGDQATQRTNDAGVSLDSAYREIALEWLIGNMAKVAGREPGALFTSCFWFKTLLDDGHGLPIQFRNWLIRSTCNMLIDFLSKESQGELVAIGSK